MQSTTQPFSIPDDPAAIAYAAGLLDGEGYVGINTAFDRKASKTLSYGVRVQITNTNAALMTWLLDHFGGHVAQDKNRRAGWKDAYRWTVNGRNAGQLLSALLPYLVIKREQANVGISLCDLQVRLGRRQPSPEDLAKKEEMKSKIHVLNRRGVA